MLPSDQEVPLDSAEKSLTIEPMKADQVDAVARLRHAAFFAGTTRTVENDARDLRILLRDDTFEIALVAEAGGVVAGTCLFVRNEIEPAHDLSPWLAGLVVAEPYRGRGIARRLVAAIEAHASRLGCNTLYLYTDDAEPLYAALGWEVVERFTQDGHEQVLMARGL